jgi:sulfite reductase (NADPH) flavoprotein alpha-component
MIGPGTGVAPFRAFVEERESLGCRGRNWLFFGDQHFDRDFLYQVEWQRWHKAGILSRIDLAFSRDQEERIYVQRRMLERAHELYAWLQQGAYVYVCGERSRMATDVHETLITIVAQEGQQDRETASAFIDDLSTQRRYLRDIY